MRYQEMQLVLEARKAIVEHEQAEAEKEMVIQNSAVDAWSNYSAEQKARIKKLFGSFGMEIQCINLIKEAIRHGIPISQPSEVIRFNKGNGMTFSNNQELENELSEENKKIKSA